MELFRTHVLVCGGGACVSSGCKAVQEALVHELERFNLSGEVKVVLTGCIGACDLGPVITVYPEGAFYMKVQPQDLPEIVESHLLKGRPVERLLYKDVESGRTIYNINEIEFFGFQKKNVLRNCGIIDPGSIDEYIGRGGYQALGKALTGMEPAAVVEEVKAAGLRGRGGGGFPTGLKWSFAARQGEGQKYVVCNADEGDPGAFMDRSILEGDPHSVIEGMMIAGYAIGASQGYVYVRAEYPLAVERLDNAIAQAREYGLLGKNIFGAGFDFDLEIRIGAGAFVCGEETALLASIEGKRGVPRSRPPFPAVEGLWARPTVLNNVETYANVPLIIEKGSAWYAQLGTEKSKGTKIFALAGDIANTGLVEVPMGTPMGKIIFDIGGGIPNGKKFKAVQCGGPSGGCIPAQHLNVPVDYDSLQELGAIMGSGGMIVMDEDTCMVDLARFFLDFVQEESCGKCVPCRIGTKRMLEILNRIASGQGREGDVETLIELGEKIKATALCGLGQTAPNPVLSTIRYFRDEYDAHIRDRRCPAGVCNHLMRAPCEHTCPADVDVPGYLHLISTGEFDEALDVIREENPFPAICGRVCDHPCEGKCRRSQMDQPLAIASLKRFVADTAMLSPDYSKPRFDKPAALPQKVAVVGGGPAGLSAAFFLARRGYGVTLYEAMPVLGGMLASGIPDYRLPQEALSKDIDYILASGVEARTGIRIGRDVTLESLLEENQAVFLAVGAHNSYKLGVEGDDLPGVYGGVEFLRDVNLGYEMPVGKKVAVIGGGNAAIDAARTARRLGAEEVTILYRRLREDMPADPHEIKDAEEEGIKIEFLVAPLRIGGRGRVESISCGRMKLGDFDRSGRRRPVQVEGADFDLAVDTVIAAIGQETDTCGIATDICDKGRLVADPDTLATPMEGVFAGGDAVRGPATVIEAIADGKRAAEVIAGYLQTGEVTRPEPRAKRPLAPASILGDDEDVVETPRVAMPNAEASVRVQSFTEVVLGYNRESAMAEAARCLKCHAQSE